jgi:hypothetical protein
MQLDVQLGRQLHPTSAADRGIDRGQCVDKLTSHHPIHPHDFWRHLGLCCTQFLFAFLPIGLRCGLFLRQSFNRRCNLQFLIGEVSGKLRESLGGCVNGLHQLEAAVVFFLINFLYFRDFLECSLVFFVGFNGIELGFKGLQVLGRQSDFALQVPFFGLLGGLGGIEILHLGLDGIDFDRHFAAPHWDIGQLFINFMQTEIVLLKVNQLGQL